MAQLDKMLIQGIRSFGPDEEDKQLVLFYSPLTLILGQNGCGKTTIIEALKYAICGETPPGTKTGQGFVHDPKLARQTEVLGKVQLKLSDVKGKDLVVTRCVQLTQKKSTSTFKTLDVSISRDGPDGKKVHLSGRCADIDFEMATAMGVSKSVLNNVIFCHQEESSWPLEEGKKLKERFDAIFDTVKHNKCLAQLTDLRKAIRNEVSFIKRDLEHLRDKKEASVRLQEEVRDIERSVSVSEDLLEKCQNKCVPIEERLKEIISQESDVLALYSKYEKLKTQIINLQQQQQELKKNLPKRYEGSVEDLKDEISSFTAVMRKKDAEYRDLSSRLETIEKEDEKTTEVMSRKQNKIGVLQSRQQMNQNMVDERKHLLEKLHQCLGLEVAAETNANVLIENVESKLQEKEDLVEQQQRDMEAEEQSLQNRVDNLRDAKVKKEQEVRMKEQEVEKNNTSLNKIKSDITEVERGANRLADIEKQLTDVKSSLETVATEMNIDEQNKDIKRFEDDENRVNQDLEKVFKEVEELQKYSETNTKLAFKQKEKNDKTADYQRLKNKNADALKHLLRAIPESGLKRKFDSCLEGIVQEINNKNIELNRINNEISKLEVNRRHKKEQVNNKEKEIKEDEEKLYENCEDRDLEDVISCLNDDIQKLQKVKGELDSQKVLYEKYVQKLEERDPCCPLCHRDFQRAEEASILIDELRSEIHTVPARLKENEEILKRNKKKYDTLLELRSVYQRVKESKQVQIPKLQKELKEVESHLKTAREEAETLQNNLLTPQLDEGIARGMQADVIVMDKCQSELKIIEAEISKLQNNLPVNASSRSLDETMKIQQELRKEVADLRKNIKNSKQALENHKNKLQKLQERKNKLVEEQLKIQAGAQQLQQMQQNVRELENSIGDLEEQIQVLRSDVTVTNVDFENVRHALNGMKAEHRNLIKEKRDTVMEWKRHFQDIRKLNQNISDYERRGINAELRVAQQDLADLEKSRNESKQRLNELVARIDKLKTEISGEKVFHRELNDNLLLFEKEREEIKLTEEKTALSKKIGGGKYEELVAEKEKLQRERSAINNESQSTKGKLEESRRRLVSLRKELAQDMYQNAAKKYSGAQREKIVKEIVDSDLAKYQKAMEWTMTQFHQERMKVINEIIHDLWRQIYRGNDIDYIKIDANAPEVASDTAKRRSYDYKVVQVKNDVEIEMRGRCSAGQKVLACLIIRIALAETLSSRCGILALDEPTTNLDKENIDSLAQALVHVVNTRMVNKGFQLIIITHDEEFVSQMRQVCGLKYYHIVSRNEEGKSRIQKHTVDGRK